MLEKRPFMNSKPPRKATQKREVAQRLEILIQINVSVN